MKRLLFMLSLLMLMLVTPSCGMMRAMRQAQPEKAWVVSSRSTYEVLSPSYRAYMAADTTTDADILTQRNKLLEDWLLMIETGETAVGIGEASE